METPAALRPDSSASAVPQPTPALSAINYRHLAEDWAWSYDVASQLTPAEHRVLVALARWCGPKVGFEPSPPLYSYCILRTRKEVTGILDQLGISHNNYLQRLHRLRKKSSFSSPLVLSRVEAALGTKTPLSAT